MLGELREVGKYDKAEAETAAIFETAAEGRTETTLERLGLGLGLGLGLALTLT